MGVKKQKGGALGLGRALGMAIPAVLGAASKILPGVFGKKGKTTRTTNNNYNRRPQQQLRQPRPPPQYYRPPPQYYRPPPQYYRPPPPQYYRPTPRRQVYPPVKRLQKGGVVFRPRKKQKKWYKHRV